MIDVVRVVVVFAQIKREFADILDNFWSGLTSLTNSFFDDGMPRLAS
jgi:hypothetical protein